MPDSKTIQVPSTLSFEKHHVPILSGQITYIDTGSPSHSTPNAPIVLFIHGNPTSSYLWRNIIPYISQISRCIAIDLIGMGDSSKVPNLSYTFDDHIHYLGAFIEKVIPEGPIVLVLHDWGSALGFDWARRHEERVLGLSFMEIVVPMQSWASFPDDARDLFQGFRAKETGWDLLVGENLFVEKILPEGVVGGLSEEAMTMYRKPFLEEGSRQPLYQFPQDIPIEGKPAEVWAKAELYHEWLLKNDLPKLFFWGTPGALMQEKKVRFYESNLHNIRTVHVGPGVHYFQEDNPRLIGTEIAGWLWKILGNAK